MTHVVALADDGSRALFDLQDGARLTELSLGGRDLLVGFEGQEPMWWGAFVMAPWTSLLRGGSFDFDGARVRVVDPERDGDADWHGVVWNREWQASAGDIGTGAIGPGAIGAVALGAPWPLGGSVRLEADLTATTLELRLRLRAGGEPMPAAIGWHPWFRRSLGEGAEVDVVVPDGALVQQRDETDRPTGLWGAPQRRWNDCLRTDGPIDLRYAGVGTLRVSYSGDFVTLFTTHPQGVCVEPVSSAAERMDDRLQPGEELSLDIRLDWIPED